MTSIKPRALTHDDIKWFFEAIGEYGKDFQNMQHYMAQRCGRKADQIRNRDQIRNFYNRLYSKLSQLINLPNDIEKVTQELYLLINYGEIWKKFGFKFDERTKKLLDDLVHNGYTTYRFRNKNVRLRTPSCKALKKINQLGTDNDKFLKVLTSSELPKDVIVEFHPATNGDWLRVQSLSQNPRVRARLSLQKRLSPVIDFLENKWNVSSNKLSKSVNRWLKIAQTPASNNNDQNQSSDVQNSSPAASTANNSSATALQAQDEVKQQDKQPLIRVLRLKPSPSHDLNSVAITRVVQDNHLDLSLNAFKKKMSEWRSKNTDTTTPKQMASSTLNTPDASILLERSSTSDEPLEKQLNVFQTMVASMEGCENSRTAYEDTQDRSLHSSNAMPHVNHLRMNQIRSEVSNHSRSSLSENQGPTNSFNQPVCDLPMPPANMLLAEWLSNFTPVENSRDRLALSPLKKAKISTVVTPQAATSAATSAATPSASVTSNDKVVSIAPISNSASTHSLNHMIDSKKLAAGWTIKDDDSTITIGELYLALNCPEKIIFEYCFEVLPTTGVSTNEITTTTSEDNSSTLRDTQKPSEFNHHLSKTFLFKLLTSASLCLANMHRMQQQKHDNFREPKSSTNRNRRRKMPFNNSVYSLYTRNNLIDNTNNCSDNDTNEVRISDGINNNNNTNVNVTCAPLSSNAIEINQKVEEALKQLKPPTRIRAYKNNRP